MMNPRFGRTTRQAAIWLLVVVCLTLAGCSAGTNCALFGLQCGAPTADQEARSAAAEATLKQENATLGPTGHYGSPYGPGPQYGDGGGDQYGYGPGYSYARQAPELPNDTVQQQK
jgi:hypothetical protein